MKWPARGERGGIPSPIKHLPNRQQSRTIDWKYYDSLPGRTRGGTSCVILTLYFTPRTQWLNSRILLAP